MTRPTPKGPADADQGAVVNSAEDAVITTTLDGVITSWNPAAERLFGYTAAEAMGGTVALITPEDREAEEGDVVARMRQGEVVRDFETVRIARAGRRVEVSLAMSPIRGTTGEIIGISTIARAIGERRLDEARSHLAAI